MSPKVLRTRKQANNTTDLALMVESNTQNEIFDYDEERISKALIKEISCPEEIAKSIANEVTERIKKSGLSIITTSLIRSFVNVVLIEKGFNRQLKSNSSVTIPFYDIKQILESPNKENGNTCHNPESINLTLAGKILKEYTLKEILPKNIAKAHLEGRIHVHDLDFPMRYYAFDGDKNYVNVRREGDTVASLLTIREVFNLLNSKEVKLPGVHTKFGDGYEIEDKDSWVKIEKIVKMESTKSILKIITDSSNRIYVTEDHPCIKIVNTMEEEVQAQDLIIGDTLYVKGENGIVKESLIFEIKRIGKIYEVFDITTSSHTLLANNIYIHNCSGHSPEYIKKYGLRDIPTIPCNSKPASSAWVLARHLCSITQFFSSQFAGAIGWEAVNMFFAPLLIGWSYDDIKQLAQTLIFDLAQLAGARGGQISFTDFNVYLGVPNHYKETLAMGKKGKYMVQNTSDGEIYYFSTQESARSLVKDSGHILKVKTLKYKDFEQEAMLFTKAILEVVKEGDADGMPFAFPKINLHVNEESFTVPEKRELLMDACRASSENGCPYFFFDRDAVSIAQCCRLKVSFTDNDMKLLDTPEELRFVGIQNVSINLPNCALENPNEDNFYKELEYRMDLAAQAHIIKRDYVWKLARMKNSPVGFYEKGMDGKPYIKLDNASYLIGIVGLNECVHNMIGQELHESEDAFIKGMEVISFMNMKAKELSDKYGIMIKLEETPAESTAGRFAKLDVRKYDGKAFVKRNEEGIYYTNSVHFAADSDVDYITRIMEQSKFHTLVEAGSMIHIWGGENKPSPESIMKLLELTWYKTDCVQWVLSPEYTLCRDCGTKHNGLVDNCTKCGSGNVTSVTRITGYYVFVHKFNEGKRAELHDRKRELIQ